MKLHTVYLVYDATHGVVGIYAHKHSAQNIVEKISVEEYDMKTKDEIWDKDYYHGNEFVYYKEEEIIY